MRRWRLYAAKRFLLLRVNAALPVDWLLCPSARNIVVCTLTLAWQAFEDAPVALVATRDESYDRPSDPPAVRGDGRYLAPRDRTAGGTWIGLGESGTVVAIANRWLDTDRDGDRSRGHLVADCLRRPTAEAAVQFVEQDVDERAYDGFTLLVADDVAAFQLTYDGSIAVTPLAPGVHVVGNVGSVCNGRAVFSIPETRTEAGTRRADSARRIAATVAPKAGASSASWLDRATAVLADHDFGACLHGDRFGTRSLTRLRTGPDPTMGFADGPPCSTPVDPVEVPASFGEDGPGDVEDVPAESS
jgi:uncharacterized protein with NRDE domain